MSSSDEILGRFKALKAKPPGKKPIDHDDLVARLESMHLPIKVPQAQFTARLNPAVTRNPYKTTESHDRLQAKFGVLSLAQLFRLLCLVEVFPDNAAPKSELPHRIVLEKPVVCDRYSRANDWRMDGVIEAPGLHVIVEIKTAIDSMGELLGQCQRYMRHYRPDCLQEGEFCPVVVACPVIEDYIIDVIEAQGFHWLANERWDQFFEVAV